MNALRFAGLMAGLAGSFAAFSQTGKTLTFEVASIRPASFPPGPGAGKGRGGPGPNRIDAAGLSLPFISLSDLLPYAFQVKDFQVIVPSWTHESRWTISAKLPDGASPDQAPEMVRSLLVDRFKMTVHREKREQPVYELTAGGGSSRLKTASPDDFKAWDGSFPGFGFRGPLQTGAAITGRIVPSANCTRNYEFVPLPMTAFADALTMFLARPVVDKSGMTGNYRLVLTLSGEAEAGMMANMMRGRGLPPPAPGVGGGRGGPKGGPEAPPPPEIASPGCADPFTLIGDGIGSPDSAIIKAVQQLGLTLQPGRAPIDTIIVDHLEKTPTEN